MVAVLTAAREYIDELKMRVGGTAPAVTISRVDSFGHLQDMISPPRSPLGMTTTAAGAAASDEVDLKALLGLPPELRKGSSDSEDNRAVRKHREAAFDVMPPMYGFQQNQQQQLVSGFFPNQSRPSLMLSVMDESLIVGANRKDSALLLPTPDPATFVYGQRDSMHAMFSLPLPHIIEPNHPSYVACGKCGRGVENLIMIDCDVCHRWYHIRCMSINPTSIPVRWTCPECPQAAN